jgi:nicotinate-nucleotide--dimethylbenzimidazole phosphoribosyltransferase
MVAGHQSVEIGQMSALDKMGLKPLLALDMRLGEGTGAAIAISLVELAARMQREMASFAAAGVSGRLS